ncbi:hypothetical protein KSF_042890 [Reticulibacter mediterranei]|uniref:Uncharacterized protein n=1 Tax=Reticulibacter mediterranei TaxID=2778369 RepID=A0A8J3IGN5_9CHLR|nr:hypothetical protein KSF_042890 [Reticulibacter mediterranei]
MLTGIRRRNLVYSSHGHHQYGNRDSGRATFCKEKRAVGDWLRLSRACLDRV